MVKIFIVIGILACIAMTLGDSGVSEESLELETAEGNLYGGLRVNKYAGIRGGPGFGSGFNFNHKGYFRPYYGGFYGRHFGYKGYRPHLGFGPNFGVQGGLGFNG